MTIDAALYARLAEIVGQEQVLTEALDMEAHLLDWKRSYSGKALAVVRPATAEEAAAVVACCYEMDIAVVPQGGNTGLCGGAIPNTDVPTIVLSTVRLNQILEINTENDTMTVQAGCILQQVQEAAAEVGRLFPLSLAAEGSCTIGGNVASNAGGIHVLRYGNTRDLVLGVEVILPDGRIWNNLKSLRKDNSGYALKHLFIGSEGTLGIVTAVTVKLFPQTRSSCAAWVAVEDPQAAVALLTYFKSTCGERVNAFELIGKVPQELVPKHMPTHRPPLGEPSKWAVLVELADTLANDLTLQELMEEVLAYAFEEELTTDAVIATNLGQEAALWALRENITECERHEGSSIKHDVSVPVSAIPDFVADAEDALNAGWPGIRFVTFGHMGDGNLHYNLLAPEDMDKADFIAAMPEINKTVYDIVARYHGSIAAEHGVGQLKRDLLPLYKSDVELSLMQTIKHALDPKGLMNPGKVI